LLAYTPSSFFTWTSSFFSSISSFLSMSYTFPFFLACEESHASVPFRYRAGAGEGEGEGWRISRARVLLARVTIGILFSKRRAP